MVYKAIGYTILAWGLGFFLDYNIAIDTPTGYLTGFPSLRTLFPILAMGIYILKSIQKIEDKTKK